MTNEHFPQDSDPPIGRRPTIEEQQQRLKQIQAKNMRTIVRDDVFFDKVKAKYPAVHGGSAVGENNNDVGVVVYRNEYGRRLDDGTFETGEHLQIGFQYMSRSGATGSSYISIARRINTGDGSKLVPDEGFTLAEAQLVAGMADELMLAKTSGQIPDLSGAGLDYIYAPHPLSEDFTP